MSFEILDIVYWSTTVAFLAVATVLAVASLWHPRVVVVGVSGAFLAAALALAALPFAALPLPAAVGVAGLSLVTAIVGGGPAASVVLEAATRGTVTQGTHGGILLARSDRRITDTPYVAPAKTEEVMRGGLVIGLLERLAIAASLMAGFPGAFAVVVAVKGVGRFTELAESESRERFIIGTLASIIWATASAGVWMLAVA